MPGLTKKAAKSVTNRLDKLANDIQTHHEFMGVPEKIARDFAYRCDILSDFLEKRAGVHVEALSEFDPVKEDGYDPEDIGEEDAGPLRDDPDEAFMTGEFTQQENRELRERQQDGDLGMKSNPEPQKPQPGKQATGLDASIDRLTKQACDAQLRTLGDLEDDLKVLSAQLNLAGGAGGVAGATTKLAGAVGKARDLLITANAHGFAGPVIIDESEKMASAVHEVLPYVSALSDSLQESKTSSSPTAQLRSQEVVEASSDRIGKLIGLAVKIADDCAKKIGVSLKAMTTIEKDVEAA